jgi:Ca-activated chloride channel family protein
MREELDGLKVTAYALGELDDDERAALDAKMAASEGARREVEDIRAAAAALREAYSSMPRYELTPEQRQAIEAAATRETDAPARRRRFPRILRVTGYAAAAAAAVVAVLAVSLPSLLRARMAAPQRAAGTPPPAGVGASLAARRPMSAQMAQEQTKQLRALGYLGGVESDKLNRLREPSAPFNTEAYDHTTDNPFILVAQDPRSTFSVDVDTASYSIVRRFLNEGQLPPRDAVRIEELINYFPYAYAPPRDGRPFAVHMDTTSCPWRAGHRLVRIGIKGRELPPGQRPPSNLVFLLDVSGSMDEPNKLPLVKAAMRLLVEQLGPRDRVAIAVYAGSEGLALPSTPGSEKTAILSAIESLSPGGTTHGSAGIRLAYETAGHSFIDGGVNRVILATDGDFNVGVTNQGDLVRLIEEKAKSGVFLTALGFGMGNLKDSTLEKLADHGNGNYAYIDSLAEARKVLVEQAGGTLVTIAKDVKLQIEFNPRRVKAFRLIGYENRVLAHQDFNDDTKDAGDIGAGHTVTALYEIVPPGAALSVPGVDPLKYQEPARPIPGSDTGELLTLKLRYKEPAGDRSSLIEAPLTDSGPAFQSAPPELRFAAAVAAFGMVLRDSPHKGDADLDQVLEWARASVGEDRGGLRAEFLQLIEKARSLAPRR